jgi:hypothetical protein
MAMVGGVCSNPSGRAKFPIGPAALADAVAFEMAVALVLV